MGWIESVAKKQDRLTWECAKATAELNIRAKASEQGIRFHSLANGKVVVMKPNGIRFVLSKEDFASVVARVARPMVR